MTGDHYIIWKQDGFSTTFVVNPAMIAKMKARERGRCLKGLWSNMTLIQKHVPERHLPTYEEWRRNVYEFALVEWAKE